MFIVVCYDVVEDRRRTRPAKIVEGFGTRVQKNIFECNVDERRYLKMKELIEKTIDWEEDGVRYYAPCRGCLKNVEVSGVGLVQEDDEVIVVGHFTKTSHSRGSPRFCNLILSS